MVLHQHRCHWIDLRAEIEEGVGAEWLAALGRGHLMTIDIGVHGCRWAQLELRVLKRKGTVPLHPGRGIRIHRVAVGVRGSNVNAVRSKREIESLCRSAHREQK